MSKLKNGIELADLYDREELKKIDTLFLSHLAEQEPKLRRKLVTAWESVKKLSHSGESALIVEPTCPVEAIKRDSDPAALRSQPQIYGDLAEYYSEKIVLPGAENWKTVTNKFERHFSENPAKENA